MNALETILTRRSIRSYTLQTVPQEIIDDLLAAAMAAPSANNQQPWQFVVVTEREMLDDLTTFLPHGQMLKQAPLAIVVCGDMSREKSKGFWVQDCAAATQNILLAAHASGLGAVWIGVYPRAERVRDVGRKLQTPETIIPFCVLSIGYPAESKPPSKRFDPTRVHQNKW